MYVYIHTHKFIHTFLADPYMTRQYTWKNPHVILAFRKLFLQLEVTREGGVKYK